MRRKNNLWMAWITLLLIGAKPADRPISLDVKDADIHNVLRLFANVAQVNIVVPGDVKGRVTIKLDRVPWSRALDVVLKSKGLGMERHGDVIRVDTLVRLNERQVQKGKLRGLREKSGSLLTVVIPVNYARALDLKPLVQSMLTPRGRVMVDARTNVLVVTDVAHNVTRVRAELGL